MSVILVSFSAYTLAIVAIGVYATRYAKTSDEDFFLAGRSLGPWVGSLSASASSESGWVTLGLVGLAFTHGFEAYWVIPGCLLGYLFNWFVLAARMNDRARALEALTLPDFFAFHFRERYPIVRSVSVVITLAAMLAYVAGQLAAAGKAFAVTFGPVNYQAGVLIGAAIVLAYTVSGGFRAVCWTDFLQALLMVGTLVVFPLVLLVQHGGYDFLHATLGAAPDAQGTPGGLLHFVPRVTTPALVGFLLGSHALGINFGYPGMPHVLVRFMALRNRSEARIGGIVAFFWGLLVYWGAVTIGVFVRAMHEQGEAWTQDLFVAGQLDGEVALVIAAIHLLPGVVSGLVLAAILAAICSTADSQLVVAASSAANDLYARLVARGRRGTHIWINRAVVLLLGLGAVLLVIQREVPVYEYVLQYGWAMLGASFGPQVILALLWKRASYAGCVAGMIVGFATVLLWGQFYDAAATGVEIYNLPLAFVLALIVNAIVSLGTSRPEVRGNR